MIRQLLGKRNDSEVAPRVAADARIYAVGDIHGRSDLLARLLDAIVADMARFDDGRCAWLVFLGDYIDRGDESATVLELLSDLAAEPAIDAVFLEGNHEAALLRFLDDPRRGKDWIAFGGQQTLASYGIKPPSDEDDAEALARIRDDLFFALGHHLAFLRGLAPFARSGDVAFVHAAVDPRRAAPVAESRALRWGHPDFLVPDPVPGLRIVHGHYDDGAPVVHPGRICVDTGAYYTGRLTAARLDDDVAFLEVGP